MLLTNITNSLSSPGFLLSLPIILLTLFAAGLLLIDLFTLPTWNWMNAATALAGILFSTAGVMRVQFIQAQLEASGRRLEWAFSHSLLIDHLSIYFFYMFLFSAAVTVLVTSCDIDIGMARSGKSYAYILLSVVGMMCMAAGFDIVILFVGLEIMSVSTYFLVGMLGKGAPERESGLKYFLRSAFSSAIFASGLSLLYGLTGNTNLQLIAQGIKNNPDNRGIIVTFALGLVAVGLFSKIGAIPFHRWMLDVCEGSPVSIAGIICVASQAAGWAMLLRILLWGLYSLRTGYVPLLIFASVITMVTASIASLAQTGVTRLLAYSSIAQVGYILLGLISLTSVKYPEPAFFEAFKGILIQLLVYTPINLGAFAVVGFSSQPEVVGSRRCHIGMECIAGLFYRAPAIAILMSIFLFSLAGMPLSAGFYGKYFIFHSLLASGHCVLSVLAFVCLVTAFYYYGRLVQVIFERDPEGTPLSVGIPAHVALGIVGTLAVVAGIYPKPLFLAVEWSLRLT